MSRRRLPHRKPRFFGWQSRRSARSRRLNVERLERRELLAATPLGATVEDTGEFLLGSVGVVPVLFESDGTIDAESQDWTADEIDALLAKVSDGVNWWSDALDQLNTVHSLEFVVDDTYARTPVSTPYEPIDRISNSFATYAGDFLTSLGYGDASSFEAAVHRFNHDQRIRLGTDWAFSLFIADASDDADGQFAPGGSFSTAFAYAGGLFIVMPSTRPASTVAHEMGHIFWARDEYPGGGSWTDTRGYYNAQNTNAWDNPTPEFEPQDSIMRGGYPLQQAYLNHTSSQSSFEMIGWRDTDDDGIFDVADVPLRLTATGYFDAQSGDYHLSGTASAMPLRNANSWGAQSDITLNRVSHLQYSVDGGPWVTAESPDRQEVSFDLTVPLAASPDSIRWRAVDANNGVTSNILESDSLTPLVPDATVSGFAFLDNNGNGVRDAGERLLNNTSAVISYVDGTPLFSGSIAAGDYVGDAVPESVNGVRLTADGLASDPQPGVTESLNAGGIPVFRHYNHQLAKWFDGWTDRVGLNVELPEPVGEVRVDVAGLGPYSYGRLEAFDAAGNSLGRSTTGELDAAERQTLRFDDAAGRIASFRVFGHAGSEIAIQAIHYGTEATDTTGEAGVWSVSGLSDGSYRVEISPESAIYSFGAGAVSTIDVVAGSSEPLAFPAVLVASPRHNAASPHDVNDDGRVSPLDALVIINDLSNRDSRVLPDGEAGTPPFIDVNNDGRVSPVDALWVINELVREDGDAATEETGEGEGAAAPPAVASTGLSPPADSSNGEGESTPIDLLWTDPQSSSEAATSPVSKIASTQLTSSGVQSAELEASEPKDSEAVSSALAKPLRLLGELAAAARSQTARLWGRG